MVNKGVSARRRVGAAERRIRGLVPGAETLGSAVESVVAQLLEDLLCPPTDLARVGEKVGVREISYERFPGSGELLKTRDGYRIVCSSDQPHARQRFTVAHELGHVILEGTGRGAPRAGKAVERVCDMFAAELLMPRRQFESRLPDEVGFSDIRCLARTFDTSVTATAIRCAGFRSICIFGVTGDRVTWGYGGVVPGWVRYLLDEVREGVRAVMEGRRPADRVFFYARGCAEGYRRFDWVRCGADSAMFLLSEESRSGE